MELEHFKIEQKGYEAGNNPFMGRWSKTFNFPAVSYSNKSELKAAFKERLQSEINVNFVYTHQVTLSITLYLNEEKMLETSEYGDLDNYAKSICDAIKGVRGLIIDDCQIQRLDISWIDVPKDSYFELELTSSPDDFASKNLSLYEMDDGLYYPISGQEWNYGELIVIHEVNKFVLLHALSAMTSAKRKLRHLCRQGGIPQFRAFQTGKYLSPVQWGFHRTRVSDSGFAIVQKSQWVKECTDWKAATEDRDLIAKLDTWIAEYRAALQTLTDTPHNPNQG